MAQIIVVASGKGGSGKSTFTAGVSRALADAGSKVLAIDCDIGLRSLDLLLDLSENVVFNWGDLLLGRCTAEQAVIKSDVDFLAAPAAFRDEFTPESVSALVKEIARDYDFVLLDAPAGLDRGFRLAAAGANRAVLISTPDSVCVRSCNAACAELDSLGIKDIRLVINMFEVKPVCKRKLLNIDQCIDETGARLLGIVPRDHKLGFCSVTGEAPGEFSPSTLAFSRLAKRLLGKQVPLVCE